LAQFKDFAFISGEYGKAKEFTDAAAVILAIKNILLTRKGNFPFNPNFGMNISKYQFDLLDEQSVAQIKAELEGHIAKYIPDLEDVFVEVQIVEDAEERLGTNQGVIGISITTTLNSEPINTSFLLYKENDVLQIFNETN